jgi:hypothetical protein
LRESPNSCGLDAHLIRKLHNVKLWKKIRRGKAGENET